MHCKCLVPCKLTDPGVPFRAIFFPKTVWKWKKIGSSGAARPWRPLGSANECSYRLQRSCGKVMFLHLPVILFTGWGCLPQCMLGYTPPWPWAATPPWADTPWKHIPAWKHTPPPPKHTPPPTVTAADWTTGMHSCFILHLILFQTSTFFCFLKFIFSFTDSSRKTWLHLEEQRRI